MKAKVLKFGLQQLKILKKVMNSLVIMVLVLMKITNNFLVCVNQKIVVVLLLERNLDGELIKNFQWPIKKNSLDKFKIPTSKFLNIQTDFGEKQINSNLKIVEFHQSDLRVYEKYYEYIKKSKNIFLILNTSIINISIKDKKVETIEVKTPSKRITINSRFLILACGGIENSRLLLWFRENNHSFLKKYVNLKY